MTIEDYRIEFGWSKSKLAREADIDMNTLKSAIDGNPIFRATAGKIVGAINQELQRRGRPTIRYTDLEGVQFADWLSRCALKGVMQETLEQTVRCPSAPRDLLKEYCWYCATLFQSIHSANRKYQSRLL